MIGLPNDYIIIVFLFGRILADKCRKKGGIIKSLIYLPKGNNKANSHQ